MPTQQNTINLIRTKTSSSPQLESIETSLRRTGMIGLVIFLCVSVVLGSVYTFYFFENQKLQSEKSALIERINAQKNKEGFLLAIKDRTKLVQKAMASQKPWIQTIDLVSTFVTAPFLTSMTVDELDKVTLSVSANSLDNILIMISSIIEDAKHNKLRNPRLASFVVGKKGAIDLTISFTAKF
jgi:hypothetical protein